jgi:hypothetical protein
MFISGVKGELRLERSKDLDLDLFQWRFEGRIKHIAGSSVRIDEAFD